MANYKELTSKEEIEDVFGERRHITFRCGNCHCAFVQSVNDIRFYESVEGHGPWDKHDYYVETTCPTCKKKITVVADEELAISPRDYWSDRRKERR